jgi:dUTP pyrophosphatase
MELRVKKLHPDAILPTKAYPGDLGWDLYACESLVLERKETSLVSTGIAIAFPSGYGGLIRDRSSIATKRELFVVAGVIDNGYRNEIKVAFYNPGHVDSGWYEPYRDVINVGDKIAQLILLPVFNPALIEVSEFEDETVRGEKGFGSSG